MTRSINRAWPAEPMTTANAVEDSGEGKQAMQIKIERAALEPNSQTYQQVAAKLAGMRGLTAESRTVVERSLWNPASQEKPAQLISRQLSHFRLLEKCRLSRILTVLLRKTGLRASILCIDMPQPDCLLMILPPMRETFSIILVCIWHY